MRVPTLLIAAVASAAYYLITFGARRRNRLEAAARRQAQLQSLRELVVTNDNKSSLYVVARRCRKNRKFLLGNNQPHDALADFERELQGAVQEFENKTEHSGLDLQYYLRYEYDIWRSTWFELAARSKHQQDIQVRVMVTGLQ